MQPWPPWALKPSAVASSPESWMKSGPMACALQADPVDLAGRVLDAGDVLQLEQPRHRLDRHVDHRARRDVVDDDRNADRVVDRLEVLVEPFLVGLVVVGRDHQHPVGAGLFGEAWRDRSPRRCCWSRRRRSPAPGRLPTSMQTSTTRLCSSWLSVGHRRWCPPAPARASPRRSASRRRRGTRARRGCRRASG